ncbi:MAG: Kdo hydroxylase family protein [Alphaproteobacteria bacterium]|nr:Kdo hydroxylase family protein [Alphaproteobacteria bacterium]
MHTISVSNWQGPFADADKSAALGALERGKVLYFPNLAFVPEQSCQDLFSSRLADRKTKNVSYNPATVAVKGTLASERERPVLQAMMAAFSATAAGFVLDLLPRYAGHIERARASYRPVEIAGREYSPLKDDKRLHVDAFPSTPTRGRRILRLFCNVNPAGQPRLWHIGEPFEALAEKFLPALGRPMAPIAYLLAAFGATRGRRSAYDQLMLGLHNNVKRDAAYQASACYEELAFPAGSTWLCFTDQVVHAAIAGQYALEQTFYLDIAAMADPASSPLRILERMTKRTLC